MPHFKTMFDPSEFLFAHDLPPGKDAVVTIDRVTAGVITGDKGKTSRKPMASFVGATKKLALNRTNAKTIATLYGPDTDAWSGKSIALYETTTTMGADVVPCIRVRNTKPATK